MVHSVDLIDVIYLEYDPFVYRDDIAGKAIINYFDTCYIGQEVEIAGAFKGKIVAIGDIDDTQINKIKIELHQ